MPFNLSQEITLTLNENCQKLLGQSESRLSGNEDQLNVQ